MYHAWICEICKHPQKFRENIWDCPGCGKEVCDDCFDRYAHCKACAAGKSDEELRLAANATGNFDFEPFDEPVGRRRPERAMKKRPRVRRLTFRATMEYRDGKGFCLRIVAPTKQNWFPRTREYQIRRLFPKRAPSKATARTDREPT